MTSNDSPHWYVLRAVFHKEIAVRDGLRRAGLHCYVPMHYKVAMMKGHKVRRLVPAISELVFVHASAESISDYKLHSKDMVYWLTKPKGERREKIIVPDKAMEDFIRVTQEAEMSVTYFRPEELNLNKGDHILIHGGPFDGVEGVLLKVKGKREKQLVVSIPDLAVAAVSVCPDVVEVVSPQPALSCNIISDARELIRLSTSMLTSPPNKSTMRHEWNLLHREIQGLYQSLLPRKGYIASTDAHISLALLLAERALDAVTDTTLQRCHAAADRLRPSKLREQLLKELEKLN